VTGGGKGIGAACVRALAEKGFRVGIHYRSSEDYAKALLSEIGEGFLLKADLANIEEVEAMVTGLKEKTGRVDVLVNNAGVSVNADINTMRVEQFDAQRAAVRGAWYLTKRILASSYPRRERADHQHLQCRRAYGERQPDPLHDGEGRARRLH